MTQDPSIAVQELKTSSKVSHTDLSINNYYIKGSTYTVCLMFTVDSKLNITEFSIKKFCAITLN